MNENRRKAISFLTGLLITTSACGQATVPDTVEESSLAVSAKGEVKSFCVDSFDKDYYSLAELTQMATAEADAYNAGHTGTESTPVMVEDVKFVDEDNRLVMISHQYDSVETYEAFQEASLFLGTVDEAIKAGYDLSEGVQNVKDGSRISKEKMLEDCEQKVLVTDEKEVIYAPGRVVAISQGIYRDNGTVDTRDTEGTVVILLK